jgi:hypothetical protein
MKRKKKAVKRPKAPIKRTKHVRKARAPKKKAVKRVSKKASKKVVVKKAVVKKSVTKKSTSKKVSVKKTVRKPIRSLARGEANKRVTYDAMVEANKQAAKIVLSRNEAARKAELASVVDHLLAPVPAEEPVKIETATSAKKPSQPHPQTVPLRGRRKVRRVPDEDLPPIPPKTGIRFTASNSEKTKAEKWYRAHVKVCEERLKSAEHPQSPVWSFSLASGIGTGVAIQCPCCRQSQDVTSYDEW